MRIPSATGGSYESQSGLADGERTVNLIPEVIEAPDGSAKLVLYDAPGLTSYCTTATNGLVTLPIEQPPKAMYAIASATIAQANHGFLVGGPNLYDLPTTAGGTAFLSNTTLMAVNGSPATMQSNGDGGVQLYITNGGTGYIYNYGGGSWDGAQGPSDVIMGGYLNTRFLALDTAATLYLSDPLDGTTWDPLQSIQRATFADPWIALIVVHQQVLLLGSMTSDWYQDVGAAPFPLAIIAGATMQVGILAPFSVAQMGGAPVWLGRSKEGAGIVYTAQGLTPVRISTFPVEYAIQHYTTTTDAIGWTYEQDGHPFYVLEFPTERKTWVFDAGSGLWSERGYLNPATGYYTSYRPRFHVFANGQHLTADRQTGAVFSMSTQTYTDVDGTGIRRLRRTPPLSDEQFRIFFGAMQVFCDVGVGLTTGQGSDPLLMTFFSSDGGKTYGNERQIGLGAIGEYQTRALLYRLGSGRTRVMETACSDPVPFRMVEVYQKAQRGIS